MSLVIRSAKATLLAIPALIAFYLLLFPASGAQLSETMGWMIIFVMFLGLPLLGVIFVFNILFNSGSSKRSKIQTAIIGAVLAGAASAFITGIIIEVWLIFLVIGGIIGFIAGATR